MGNEMATCEVCGVEVKRQGLGVHKARSHGIRGAAKGGPKGNGTAKVQPSAAISGGNGCESCCFRGLDRAIDQDLVRRAVVGGMSLEAACAFVREAKAALTPSH